MTPDERRSVILQHHKSLHSLSRKIAVKQESIVVAIQTGVTASPKFATECKRIGVDMTVTKSGRQWRQYRFGDGV
jgi:hypothetical protein